MDDLFSKKSQAELESFCARAELFCFDFDGTLAPIVKDPAGATMRLSTKRLLDRVIKLRKVAIVSGRTLGELKNIVNCNPHYLISYNAREYIESEPTISKRNEELCLYWESLLKDSVSKLQGVQLENKTYALAVHYRNSREREYNRSAIIDFCSNFDPAPQITFGKCVLHLVPENGGEKGVAFMKLIREGKFDSLFYVGDDKTDESVFSLDIPNFFTLHIGERASSRAKYFIRSQGQIDLVLRQILSILERE